MKNSATRILVLGAGLAGLSAAFHLEESGQECEVFEKEGYVGGHSRTKRVDGFNFDEGAHVFFGKGECADRFVWDALRGEMLPHAASIWNCYEDLRVGRYPVQANAHALSPEQATRCVLGFLEAARQPEGDVQTYEDWCYASFGREFSEEFFFKYARKIWTVEPRELTTEWLGSKVGGRISRPSVEQVIRGAIDSESHELNYLTEFSYPAEGGFGRIADPLLRGISQVRLKCGVRRIVSKERVIEFEDGSKREYDAAISTIPLPALMRTVVDAPPEVKAAAEKLMWTSIRCVNLGVAREDVGRGHWIYFYDHEIPFFRVSFPSTFSPGNAPAGHSSLTCEIAYSRRKPLNEERLVERCVEALRVTGILEESDRIVVEDEVDIPYGYVVFDFNRNESVRVIHEWMESVGLYPCGRFGEWGYHWSFEAIESGKRVAERVGEEWRSV
jgi:protoporphyrinogen oxidase